MVAEKFSSQCQYNLHLCGYCFIQCSWILRSLSSLFFFWLTTNPRSFLSVIAKSSQYHTVCVVNILTFFFFWEFGSKRSLWLQSWGSCRVTSLFFHCSFFPTCQPQAISHLTSWAFCVSSCILLVHTEHTGLVSSLYQSLYSNCRPWWLIMSLIAQHQTLKRSVFMSVFSCSSCFFLLGSFHCRNLA